MAEEDSNKPEIFDEGGTDPQDSHPEGEIVSSTSSVATSIQGTNVRAIDLNNEMRESYLAYAISVIVERALPDVRDGLKPVHRRVIYAMYDGGYRPDRGYNKCSRVVGDVMGKYHPHGDSAIYDTLVRMAQPWSMRYPLVDGQGNFGSPGNDPAAAMRYTECRMASLAMEMVRDIDKDTVDFVPNYDGKTKEPTVLPSRFPNLLVNGSSGIAVGMATNIPPHNLREIAEGIHWSLQHPDATREELLEKLLTIVKGPDFPTAATILGHKGIEQAYRTGRGLITMRAVVNTEEIHGRTCLVVTELPYQVNPDKLASAIRDVVRSGKIKGIADMRDETSGRTGQRLVLVLKHDAVPKVVLNNLYKHTQLQTTFGANMLALVDGVPRTLTLDAFVQLWINHQIEVIERRTIYLKREAEERDHILQGYLKAIDAIDEVIKLIRASRTVDIAREGLMKLLDVDQIQADAILAMQLRRLAALEREKILNEHEELLRQIKDYEDILAHPGRQRQIVGDELDEIVARFGDERRTRLLSFAGEMADEDFIEEKTVVVTTTRSGFIKSTSLNEYRAQHRGGKGIKGTQLRTDDIVDHFLTTSNHDWLLFFTNRGRVYRLKAYEISEGSRDSKGQHVANLLQLQPGEKIQAVLPVHTYDQAEFLVLATKRGKVKKTRLKDYDSTRQGGLLAIKLASQLLDDSDGEDEEELEGTYSESADESSMEESSENTHFSDEVIGAALCNNGDDLILVSRHGMSVKFPVNDEQLRPMGRYTSGVQGMKFRENDELLSMDVVSDQSSNCLLVVTTEGFGKRTPLSDYRLQSRNGYGIKALQLNENRGSLVGALVVRESDDVMVIMLSGKVVRFRVGEIKETGRATQGVTIAKPAENDEIIEVALADMSDDEEENTDNNTENSDISTQQDIHADTSPKSAAESSDNTNAPGDNANNFANENDAESDNNSDDNADNNDTDSGDSDSSDTDR